MLSCPQFKASAVSRLLLGTSSPISECHWTDYSPLTPSQSEARDLDDKDHQALDKSILEALGLYIELNREPKWAFLLSSIVNNDARLSTLSVEGAEELLKRESFLMGVLQKGWIDRSLRRFVD